MTCLIVDECRFNMTSEDTKRVGLGLGFEVGFGFVSSFLLFSAAPRSIDLVFVFSYISAFVRTRSDSNRGLQVDELCLSSQRTLPLFVARFCFGGEKRLFSLV